VWLNRFAPSYVSTAKEISMSRQDNEGRGEGWVIGQMALLLAIVLAPPDLASLPRLPDRLRLVGLALGVCGGIVAALGARQLGSNLTPFPRPKPDSELVEGGIYGRVRHPIYSGILLGAIGYALLRASLPSLLLSAALGVFFEQKARHEERWLEARYPGYAAYRERVRGRILPR
jgi:protein-S-isoprenylcysteine O-methyltransferase Ste14